MEITFEVLRKDDIGLNAPSILSPLRKYTWRDT